MNQQTPNFRIEAEQAILLAGNYLKDQFTHQTKPKHSYKGDTSLSIVTSHDPEAESIIVTHLKKKFPDLGFVGEEHGAKGKKDARYVAYIDPLDGTTNFSMQIPQFVSMLAIYDREENRVVCSVIFDPMSQPAGRLYSAQWNSKTGSYDLFKSGNRIRPHGPETPPSRWMVLKSTTGHLLPSGYLSKEDARRVHAVDAALEENQIMSRNSGSSGFDTANMIDSISNGHACGCMARGGGAWDFLPALPFALGLGGTFSMPVDAKAESWQADAAQVSRMRPDAQGDAPRYFDWIVWGSESVVRKLETIIRDVNKEQVRNSFINGR